jgi:hypothetical protein
MHAAASDLRLDFSLRFLNILVSGAIALLLLWFVAMLLEPWLDVQRLRNVVPIVEPDPLSTRTVAAALASEQVGPPATAAAPMSTAPVPLIAPAFTVFRCELRGRVTYADQPCERGGMRVLRLPVS